MMAASLLRILLVVVVVAPGLSQEQCEAQCAGAWEQEGPESCDSSPCRGCSWCKDPFEYNDPERCEVESCVIMPTDCGSRPECQGCGALCFGSSSLQTAAWRQNEELSGISFNGKDVPVGSFTCVCARAVWP